MIKINEHLYAKFEAYNPTGSIKDRMALYILDRAEEQGLIKKGDTIIEASSGNTGIAFSMLGAVKGYKVKIIMPNNMSEERKQMMRLYGAEIIEVGHNAFKEAIALRDQMNKKENYWSPKQFCNECNVKCHEETTAKEIIKQLFVEERKEIEALICGAGTGGTIMGVSQSLKKINKDMKTILVAPLEDAALHGIQGINDGADFLVDRSILDGEIKIATQDAIDKARSLAKDYGLLVGISSGANILASEKWIKENKPQGVVITFLCDRGERYMSIY
jgi:cysteine synthase A|tara:strand:+ start:9425 stop:10249 length:825 start_codon:yes stop_codon:yes gene_type:complete